MALNGELRKWHGTFCPRSRVVSRTPVPPSLGGRRTTVGKLRPRVRMSQSVWMDPVLETVSLTLWRSDAVVLFDWLKSTDLNAIPMRHPAEKQALKTC
jgi:hypothetical protein